MGLPSCLYGLLKTAYNDHYTTTMATLKQLIPALLLALTSQASFAGYVTGARLYDMYESKARISGPKSQMHEGDADNVTQLIGYVMGVLDVYEDKLLCYPSNMKLERTMDTVRQYVQAHPERWKEHGDYLVLDALKPAYSCAKKTKPQS